MWTDTARVHYARADLALPSDLTDAEWAVLQPFFPPPLHVRRPRRWLLRRIIEAILYLLRGGLPRRMLLPCFPPVSTVRRWFYLWSGNGLWLLLNDALLLMGREAVGRKASPSAGVIDSQSVKRRKVVGLAAMTRVRRSRGASAKSSPTQTATSYYAVIHTADIQDRDGAPLVLAEIVHRFPWLRHVFADGGYAGHKLKDTLRRFGKWTIAIIKRSDAAKGFEVRKRGLRATLRGAHSPG